MFPCEFQDCSEDATYLGCMTWRNEARHALDPPGWVTFMVLEGIMQVSGISLLGYTFSRVQWG